MPIAGKTRRWDLNPGLSRMGQALDLGRTGWESVGRNLGKGKRGREIFDRGVSGEEEEERETESRLGRPV